MRRTALIPLAVAFATAIASGLAAAPSQAAGAQTDCTTVASAVTQTMPPPDGVVPVTDQVQIADPDCGFDGTTYTDARFTPLTTDSGTALSEVFTGILSDHAAYRIEVPINWNGTLVMYAHGYRGTGDVVYVSNPELRTYFIRNGYAWAASSYSKNGYDVGTGAVDTHDLLAAFPTITEADEPTTTIMQGLSMGGAITTVEIENYRGSYDGAMPYCGVLAGNKLFDYFLGANVTAAALTDTDITYPKTIEAGAEYASTYQQTVINQELPALGITPNPQTGGRTFSTDLTPAGERWREAVEQISGGDRPGFASAFRFWNSFGFAPITKAPFLFGLYPGLTGGSIYYADGNVAGNVGTTYRFKTRPGRLSGQERRLNADVLRVNRTRNFRTDPVTTELPDVVGDPGIPVLSIHGIGDLFVPFSMDQDYARLMAANGEGNLFVGRAIREVAHCGYTTSELADGFHDLIQWVQNGKKPAGDDILDPKAVRSPHFGCRFTDPTPGAHPLFSGPRCPSEHSHGRSH